MKSLTLPKPFFDVCRDPILFGGQLNHDAVDGLNGLLAAMGAAGWSVAWTAYGLATAFHETAKTMRPIRERGAGDANHNGEDDWFEKYDVGALAEQLGNTPGLDGDGQRYEGRGYVMITGRRNYQRATDELHAHGLLDAGLSLVAQPDLALHPDVAAPILVLGLSGGWFTSRRLGDYLADERGDADSFVGARRVVNSQDKASLIASYAIKFQAGLQLGSWA